MWKTHHFLTGCPQSYPQLCDSLLFLLASIFFGFVNNQIIYPQSYAQHTFASIFYKPYYTSILLSEQTMFISYKKSYPQAKATYPLLLTTAKLLGISAFSYATDSYAQTCPHKVG